ncbi:restriction endonuclease [Haloferax marisrubri]|uniref:Restriction endonuclease type IV Mrr domain-containing protein n=1 Tax=Haloferax marisrubri TaxID=1544719 RepID=A0A2P4NPK3_9EURY|nr:restriction endonuclease [Haloferax marisrubri]POG55066.1 hypothetical protein AUR65_011600 [Haloferax marisrubri]
MSNRHNPEWYDAGSVRKTIERAVDDSVPVYKLIDFIHKKEYSSVSERRVKRLVEGTLEQLDEKISQTELSQPRSTDSSPRPMENRRADVDDVEYLSTDEFARVLGVVLQRFEGRTRRSDVRDSAVDLYWNRSHTTVGIRTVSVVSGCSVSAQEVRPMVDGNTKPREGRAPSDLVVVTNGTFDADARELADEHGIFLCNGDQLEQWFRIAGVSDSLLADVLERGKEREFDMDARVEEEPSIPPQVTDFDVIEELSSSSASRPEIVDEEHEIEPPSEPPQGGADESPQAGEYGRLGADESEDADGDVFGDLQKKVNEQTNDSN